MWAYATIYSWFHVGLQPFFAKKQSETRVYILVLCWYNTYMNAALTGATLRQLDDRVAVPGFDRDALTAGIVHIGVGGFHRAHMATYIDEVCALGHREWAIVGSGVVPGDERMAAALGAQDGLYTLIVRGEGATSVRVVGSIVDYILATESTEELVSRIAQPETRIVSLTVTEGGYPVDPESGLFDPKQAPAGPHSAFGVLVSALRRRHDSGVGPLAVMSCDNVISNGDVTRTAVLGVAHSQDPRLSDWIAANVTFPSSMVDRITPATTDADREWLTARFGVVDQWPVVAEPFRQWVIEDSFAAGRPPWEEVGVTVTDDVEPYELMKLRLLNAGHSSLAYLSALAGIELVDEAMAEPLIRSYLAKFLETEAGPVLPDIPGIDVLAYQTSLLERFSNPAIGDQISRLCLDGSAKFPKFLMPTVRGQLRVGGPIRLAALALAGWCSYLVGTADDGSVINHASDPDLKAARAHAAASVSDPVRFLSYQRVFGTDLASESRFREAFAEALSSLRSIGTRSTLEAFLK